MLYILSLLKNKVENVYTINVSEKPYIYNKNVIEHHRCVEELSSEKMDYFIGMKKKLNSDDYSAFMKLWEKIQHENLNLRFIKDKSIFSVPKFYFDETILSYINCLFGRCSKTVGEIMTIEENYISDIYLFWRILELIKLGKIEYRGNLRSIKHMEVRKLNI